MNQQSTQMQEDPNQTQKRRETQKADYLWEEREGPKVAKPKTWKDWLGGKLITQKTLIERRCCANPCPLPHKQTQSNQPKRDPKLQPSHTPHAKVCFQALFLLRSEDGWWWWWRWSRQKSGYYALGLWNTLRSRVKPIRYWSWSFDKHLTKHCNN